MKHEVPQLERKVIRIIFYAITKMMFETPTFGSKKYFSAEF